MSNRMEYLSLLNASIVDGDIAVSCYPRSSIEEHLSMSANRLFYYFALCQILYCFTFRQNFQ